MNDPMICPYCRMHMIPTRIYIHNSKEMYGEHGLKYRVMQCTNNQCKIPFILEYKESAIYSPSSQDRLLWIPKFQRDKKEFSEIITSISEKFVEIYNQAYFAEQDNLFEICGVGYRKALEFLIKDFAILKNSDKSEEIKNMPLAKCINTYVIDANIKNVSQRAVWLWNDETHYVRKWENKDIHSLKGLIDLTVRWIENLIETEIILEEMSQKKTSFSE